MKNHFRFQPKINAVSIAILLAYVGLTICCLRTSATPETLTPQKNFTLLANRNPGANNLSRTRGAGIPETTREIAVHADRLAAITGNDSVEVRILPAQNTLRVAVLPEPIVEINGKILLENRRHNHKITPLANR